MHPRTLVLPLAALLLTACGSEPATDAAGTASPSPRTSNPSAEATSGDGLPTEPPGTFAPSRPAPSPTATTTAPQPTPTRSPAPAPEPEPTRTAPPPPPDAPATATVTIADFDYAPDPVEIAAGGTITWTNQDSTAHTATVSGGPGTGAISGGASASLTLEAPGTYDYVCQFHPGSMTGTIVVR